MVLLFINVDHAKDMDMLPENVLETSGFRGRSNGYARYANYEKG